MSASSLSGNHPKSNLTTSNLERLYSSSKNDDFLARASQQQTKNHFFQKHDIGSLQGVLGPQASSWDFSEESLNAALEVRIQQEKTKQEYYKTEQLGRTFEIMKIAVHAKVPGHLIPTLFNVSEETLMKLNDSQMKQLGHERSKSLQTGFKPQHERTPSQLKNNPMANFRFGSGSSTPLPPRKTSLSVRHQLSPSRIGAQAISASLASAKEKPSQPRMSHLRHGSNHQRTTSLPASVCIPETKELKFNESEMLTEKRQRLEIAIPSLDQETPKKRKVVQDFDSELPTPTRLPIKSKSIFFETPSMKQLSPDESYTTPPNSKAGSPIREETIGELPRTYSLPKFPNNILS